MQISQINLLCQAQYNFCLCQVLSYSFIYIGRGLTVNMAKNDWLSRQAITPDWEGLNCFWQDKYPLFILVQRRMWWLGGWKVRVHPVLWLLAKKNICNGKQSSHRKFSLQNNNKAIWSCANAAQNDGFCNAANDPKMNLTQQLATYDKFTL